MTDLRQAAQQALEALECMIDDLMYKDHKRVIDISNVAITALRTALEQQQAEPVAWMYDCGNGGRMYAEELDSVPGWMPLYTTPPQRKPLTDEEIHNLDPFPHKLFDQERLDFARAIEAAHGIEGEA